MTATWKMVGGSIQVTVKNDNKNGSNGYWIYPGEQGESDKLKEIREEMNKVLQEEAVLAENTKRVVTVLDAMGIIKAV